MYLRIIEKNSKIFTFCMDLNFLCISILLSTVLINESILFRVRLHYLCKDWQVNVDIYYVAKFWLTFSSKTMRSNYTFSLSKLNRSAFDICSGILQRYCSFWYKYSSLQVSNDAPRILSLVLLVPRCPARRDVMLGLNATAGRTRKIATVNRFIIITMGSPNELAAI